MGDLLWLGDGHFWFGDGHFRLGDSLVMDILDLVMHILWAKKAMWGHFGAKSSVGPFIGPKWAIWGHFGAQF